VKERRRFCIALALNSGKEIGEKNNSIDKGYDTIMVTMMQTRIQCSSICNELM